jgi:hypothetical protein
LVACVNLLDLRVLRIRSCSKRTTSPNLITAVSLGSRFRPSSLPDAGVFVEARGLVNLEARHRGLPWRNSAASCC